MVAGYERGVPGGIHTRENKKSLDILRLYCTADVPPELSSDMI